MLLKWWIGLTNCSTADITVKSEDTAVWAADDVDVDDTAAAAGDHSSEEQSKLHSGVNDSSYRICYQMT